MKQDQKHQWQLFALFLAIVFALLAPVVWAIVAMLRWFE